MTIRMTIMMLAVTAALAGCDDTTPQGHEEAAHQADTLQVAKTEDMTTAEAAAGAAQDEADQDKGRESASATVDTADDAAHQSATDEAGISEAPNLPFAENIVAYFRTKLTDELKVCRASGIALQSTNPEKDCYDRLDAAFIKPRILFENDAVALLSTRNMFGMGENKMYGVEAISLKKSSLRPLWGALGSDFEIHAEDNEINIRYQTTEFSRPIEKQAQIRL